MLSSLLFIEQKKSVMEQASEVASAIQAHVQYTHTFFHIQYIQQTLLSLFAAYTAQLKVLNKLVSPRTTVINSD